MRTLADTAIMVDTGAGVDDCRVSDRRTGIDHRTGANEYPAAEAGFPANHRRGMYNIGRCETRPNQVAEKLEAQPSVANCRYRFRPHSDKINDARERADNLILPLNIRPVVKKSNRVVTTFGRDVSHDATMASISQNEQRARHRALPSLPVKGCDVA